MNIVSTPDYNAPLQEPPRYNFLQWIAQNPEAFAAYLQRVYALSNLQIAVTINGVTTRYPIKFSATNAIVEIPLS